MRSVIGRTELDEIFGERDETNSIVVAVSDEAVGTRDVKVLCYEIKDLTPPQEILHSMQAQITAGREKRTHIAESEDRKTEQISLASGQHGAEIQQSEGEAQAVINASNGEKIARTDHIQDEAEANADAVRKITKAVHSKGGAETANLKVAEQHVATFSNLAKENNTLIMPANIADIGSLVLAGLKIVGGDRPKAP